MIVNSETSRRIRKKELEEEDKRILEEKEKSQKNGNFVQIYRENMPELRWLMANNGFACSVLFFILEHMDGRNALACSSLVLEDYFKKSRTTISRAVKLLKENGFLDILKMGNSNVYIVNTEVGWTSYNNQKELAKFDGKILISKKDNKDYVYRSQFDKFKSLRQRENIKN